MNQEKLGLLLIVASHFDSRTDVLKTLNGMTPGVDNLITINNTSQHKVEYRLGPQRTIFGQDVGKSAAHRRQTKKATNTERRRNQPTNALPNTGNVALRPTYTGEKQERNRGKYNKQHNILAIMNNTRDGHTKEYHR